MTHTSTLPSSSVQSSSLQSSSLTSSPNSSSLHSSAGQSSPASNKPSHHNPLQPVRDWLDHLEVSDSKTAHRLAKLIPAQCPFERDLKLFGRTLAHIPPLCKLNPFYDQFVGLRFRALCYLVDECGEDIQSYC
jgi:Mo-dependent nitrogenase C-terminus